MALFVDSELNHINDIWDQFNGVFETNGEIVRGGRGSQELDVVDICGLVVAKSILITVLQVSVSEA